MTRRSSVRIRDISDLVTKGTTPTTIGRSYTSSGVRFLKVESFDNSGHLLKGREAFIDATTNRLLKRSQLVSGDLLFSIAGALGRSTVVREEWLPANTNQAFAIIRLSGSRSGIDPRFVLWQLRSPGVVKHIAEINVQAAQANLSLEQVRDFRVPLLPLSEQRSVAEALDDIEALISALTALITKKQAIKQGMMQELLTGKTRLPGFNRPWSKVELGDLAEVVSGGTPSSSVQAYWDGGIPWATPTDITSEGGRYLNRTERTISKAGLEHSAARLLPAGSLLLCTRATVGEVKIALVPTATNQGFKSLVPNSGVSSAFLYYKVLTLKDALTSKGSGSTFLEVSKRDVTNLFLEVPDSSEQIAIATALTDADDEIDCLTVRLSKACDIKQGMMQELLTGRTRLPVQEVVA